MPRGRAKATRLPSGNYAWRGRAVAFSQLPGAERHRFRSSWARKGAATVRREQAPIRAAQRVATRAYLAGDLGAGRRNWENRDRSKPERLYYYHGKKGRK